MKHAQFHQTHIAMLCHHPGTNVNKLKESAVALAHEAIFGP